MASHDKTNDIFDAIADIVIAREEPWRDKAACKGLNNEVFYPKQNQPYVLQNHAKKICEQCTVVDECRNDWKQMHPAMQKHGVWFGTTDKERRDMPWLFD